VKHITFLLVCLSSWAPAFTDAQLSESLTPSKYFYQFARVLLTNGTAREGWFLGNQRDSVVIQIGRISERFSRKDLLRVVIDAKPDRSTTAFVGMFAGIYAGNAFFLTDENQPFLFLGDEYESGWQVLVYNALFVFVGGGIGYLVASVQSDELTFDFTGADEEIAARWAELCETDTPEQGKAKVHITFQASWVSGPLPHANSGYGIEPPPPLNMLRKLQLTYTVTDFADIGLALMWLGQPQFSSYNFSSSYSLSSANLNGRGYYAVGVFKPLWKLKWRAVQWDVGIGAGRASVDFTATQSLYYTGPSTLMVEKRKETFSAFTFTEFKWFIAQNFSIGLTADFVYIPENVPQLQGINFQSSQLGTTSVGFVFGIHL
jgi:hypothetical protein